MNITELVGIFFSALIINNIILIRFIGLCSFFGVSDKMENSFGMSGAVIFVMVLASSVTWLVYHYLLLPLGLVFLRTLIFILVIASLVQLVELFMKKYLIALYRALGIYLPLITTNCAILAVAFLNIDYNYNFVQMLVYTVGVAGGYSLAIILFSSLRERLKLAPVPDFIRGYPLVFFTAALMSLAFMGFSGLFGLH